jgi:long-chain acyl-CoA synthetase
MEKNWIHHYPEGVAHEVDLNKYRNAVDVMQQAVARYRDNVAFHCMGTDLTFGELDEASKRFASYLQNDLGLKAGERIALQMPNILQFPVALFGALRAGLIVVNTNPLYTEREMQHQFEDSGAVAIVIVANFASKLEQILPHTQIKHVMVTELGDFLKGPKKTIVNFVVRHIKKMVPKYRLPNAVSFSDAVAQGKVDQFQAPDLKPEDIAFLQYTGGTTGVAKGAMLTHRNVVSNMLMIFEWMKPMLREGEEIVITPLPLYHIFSLTVNCLAFMAYGGTNHLITNPRDIKGFLKELSKTRFTAMSSLNTLMNGMMNHPDFDKVDWSNLKVTVAGGMAMQTAVIERWEKRTQSPLVEGLGLTEASPVVACNPLSDKRRPGTIGVPLPSTIIKLVDDNGKEVPVGEPGELILQGPQVMKGYWKKEDETAKTMKEGWLYTGDIAVFSEDGFLRVVDRKKDMILVSGFNVYPNEVEDVLASHEGIAEVAAIGIPDEHSTEAVKIFVVKKDPSLTKEEIDAYAKENLTGYKRPKEIEFRDELPKSPVGKILRKELRPGPA